MVRLLQLAADGRPLCSAKAHSSWAVKSRSHIDDVKEGRKYVCHAPGDAKPQDEPDTAASGQVSSRGSVSRAEGSSAS